MEPEKKAYELFFKMQSKTRGCNNLLNKFKNAKECALVAVNSHIYSENDSPFPTMQSWVENEKFWNEVKSEIEKL